MNAPKLRWTLAAVVIGAALLAGCSSNQSKTDVPAASSRATPQATAPSGETEHGEAAEALPPAGTTTEIWSQITAERAKLSTAIENGQLKDVHHLAFGIRDYVVALADKASAAAPASAATLKGLVEKVKTSASKLDELGDAGNLSGTQAEFAKLNALLDAIKTAAGEK